jgi:hypothetical protein
MVVRAELWWSELKLLVVRPSRRIQAPGLGYEIHDRLRNYCYVSYAGEGKCDKFAQKMATQQCNRYQILLYTSYLPRMSPVIRDTKSRDGHHSYQEHPGYHPRVHHGIVRGITTKQAIITCSEFESSLSFIFMYCTAY